MSDFDYQWANLPSEATEYTEDRVLDLLRLTRLPGSFFRNKRCLDCGCGNGRFTWAMHKLGANVESFDTSAVAVERCKRINPNAYVFDIMNLPGTHGFDFVLCWGVLHHLASPELGFKKVAGEVKSGGTLHIMVYRKATQKPYEEGRKLWPTMNHQERLAYCERMAVRYKSNVHGWWDALNPTYNYSFKPSTVKDWFKHEGFREITLTEEISNINMRGVMPDV